MSAAPWADGKAGRMAPTMVFERASTLAAWKVEMMAASLVGEMVD